MPQPDAVLFEPCVRFEPAEHNSFVCDGCGWLREDHDRVAS